MGLVTLIDPMLREIRVWPEEARTVVPEAHAVLSLIQVAAMRESVGFLANIHAAGPAVVPAQARGAKTAYASGWQMALVRRFRTPVKPGATW